LEKRLSTTKVQSGLFFKINDYHIKAFWTSEFSTKIAEVEMFCLSRYTPISSVGIKKGRAMMDPAFALLKAFIDFGYVY